MVSVLQPGDKRKRILLVEDKTTAQTSLEIGPKRMMKLSPNSACARLNLGIGAPLTFAGTLRLGDDAVKTIGDCAFKLENLM